MTKEQIKKRLEKFVAEYQILPDNIISQKNWSLVLFLIDELEIPFEFDCEYCEDTGEVSVDEAVYQGEPHMAATGTEKCVCSLSDPDDYDDQD